MGLQDPPPAAAAGSTEGLARQRGRHCERVRGGAGRRRSRRARGVRVLRRGVRSADRVSGTDRERRAAAPATHYGVYKVANEETARVYWDEHRIASIGFRPLSVYGPGRDFGLTADPTLAIKAAVLGRKYQIRWGGRTDLIYTEDVAPAFIAASRSKLGGARVYNLHGESTSVADIVKTIESAWPSAAGLLSYVDQPVPFPDHLDDGRLPARSRPRQGHLARRLDARELP